MKLFDLFPLELKEQVVDFRIKRHRESNKIEYTFPRVKKLPLETKRQVLSALNHFYNVKGVNKEEIEVGSKKVIQRAKIFEICTIAFLKQFEAYLDNNKL